MIPTPSAATKTGVFWTQFPATELTDFDGNPVDWSDHKAAHRAVSRLFQPRLPGARGERRAEAGILYRLDMLRPVDVPTVIVQSLVPPELTPGLSRTTEVSRRAWDVEAGQRVALRLAVNPVFRTTRYFEDKAKSRPASWSNLATSEAAPRDESGKRVRANAKSTARVVPAGEIEPWLISKVGQAITGIEIVNHFRDKTVSGHHRLVVDTIDAMATVADPLALSELRLRGVGRSKAYGCGLLTVTRID